MLIKIKDIDGKQENKSKITSLMESIKTAANRERERVLRGKIFYEGNKLNCKVLYGLTVYYFWYAVTAGNIYNTIIA